MTREMAGIHGLVARGRRRLRWQAFFEGATLASFLAGAVGLAVIYAWRRGWIAAPTARAGFVAALSIVVVGGVVAALRGVSARVVATRIDRASGLHNRLTTALDFQAALASAPAELHDDTRSLMEAAIGDAVSAVPRADVRRATPLQPPRDLQNAMLFLGVASLVAGLGMSSGGRPNGRGPRVAAAARADARNGAAPPADNAGERFDDDDLIYTRDLVAELRRTAQETQDTHLMKFVDRVDQLLTKADQGEISKQELLAELDRAEKEFMEGANDKTDEALADLKEAAKELEKDPVTRDLGEALEKGDLDRAKEELGKLADKIDRDELSPQQREKAAAALEKTAQKLEERESQRQDAQEQEIARKQDEVRRLERQMEQAKSPEEKRRLAERLDNHKRELKRLERNREEQKQSASKRTLKRLQRNMHESAQEMNQQDSQRRRQASRKLHDAAEDAGQMQQQATQQANQKRISSQMGDLREALRRAKRQQGNGRQRDPFGKNARNQDFERRASGGQGSRGAWKPGDKGGQQGRLGQGGQPGQTQEQPGSPGSKPGDQQGGSQAGDQWGNEHDPNVLGAETDPRSQLTDEQLAGQHGRGPSKRQTILSAAQRGFASASYRKVFADYKAIVEEVMRAEKVPSGYKYYVKRYFQKIKPHAVE